MKHISLKSQKEKSVIGEGFLCGLNTQNHKSAKLREAVNVYENDRTLETRKGIRPCENGHFKIPFEARFGEKNYFVTETKVMRNAQEYTVAYVVSDDGIANVYICVYLISKSGSVTNAGSILFGRTTDTSFFAPESITFFAGKSQSGGGLFAFASLFNRENPEQKGFSYYEINADFNNWRYCFNYYIPTVYINGRGNAFGTIEAQNNLYSEKPKVLESANMLTGRFYAYYTSDGVSSLFRLPFARLSDTNVICRIYTDVSTFTEWVILAGSNSVTMPFLGAEVTMNVDREKGAVYFTVNSSLSSYSVPVMSLCSANNIRISAAVENDENADKILSCKIVKKIGDRLVFAGGIEENAIYISDFENSLYFPVNNCFVGDSQAVTAIDGDEEKVYVFKADKLYSLTITEGEAFNSTTLLLDNPSIFKKPDTFKLKLISNNLGCKNAKSVKMVGGKLVWQARDQMIYFYEPPNKITLASNDIANMLIKHFSNSFAVLYNNHYLLCSKNKMVIMNVESHNCYLWDFGPDFYFINAVDIDNEPCFICADTQNTICYTAFLNGEKDAFLEMVEDGVNTYDLKIKSTVLKALPMLLKKGRSIRLNSSFLELQNEGRVNVKMGCNGSLAEFELQKSCSNNVVKLILGNVCDNEVYIRLESEDRIKLFDIDIYFNECY